MFNNKKAQQALEFMVILIFSLTLIAIAMYVSGVFLTEIQEQDNADTVKNFVESINKEISLLSRVEGGYYRELEVTSSRYDINLTQDLLIIKDLEDGNKTYYYDLTGDFNAQVKMVPRYGQEITLIVFEKKTVDFYEGLSLEENGTDISEEILSFTAGNLTSTIVNSINCPADYTKLFGFNFLTFINMSHGQINSVNTYPWSSCIYHNLYSLSTPTTCNDENRLFYLGAESESHLWDDNSSALPPLYPGYYDWKEVCLETNSDYVNINYSINNLSSQGYVCVGSYFTNDMSMGANIGDCQDYSPAYTKIWIRINETPSP